MSDPIRAIDKDDEIERLNEDIVKLKDDIIFAAKKLQEKDERIEGLEADVRFYRDGDVEDSTDPVMLRKRIKELEQQVAYLKEPPQQAPTATATDG